MTIEIKSAVFDDGTPIPPKYSRDGEDVSPPLAWSTPPDGTRALALVCEDPDAPREEPFVHWVLYNLPPEADGLEESSVAGVAGRNDWDEAGWGGPQPPPGHGTHHYIFRLYALDTKVDLEPGATKDELLEAVRGHVLDEGELTGTYERPAE